MRRGLRRWNARDRDSPPSIYCQCNFTHVWSNLKNQFGTGSTAMIKHKSLCPGKQVLYLLCNTRTGDRIAIGKVGSGFVIWSRFQRVSDVPEDTMKDILALVAHAWTGEKWGAMPITTTRKSTRKRSRPVVYGRDDL
jgi:hypothetical protein